MIDWLSAALGKLVRSPGWQLVVAGVILAFAFPSHVSGTIGLIILAAALGIGVYRLWPKLRAPKRSSAELNQKFMYF